MYLVTLLSEICFFMLTEHSMNREGKGDNAYVSAFLALNITFHGASPKGHWSVTQWGAWTACLSGKWPKCTTSPTLFSLHQAGGQASEAKCWPLPQNQDFGNSQRFSLQSCRDVNSMKSQQKVSTKAKAYDQRSQDPLVPKMKTQYYACLWLANIPKVAGNSAEVTC